jgi:hypothetical protein
VQTTAASGVDKTKPLNVMRKHMTSVIAELMQANKNVVYIGEDVVHGGSVDCANLCALSLSLLSHSLALSISLLSDLATTGTTW